MTHLNERPFSKKDINLAKSQLNPAGWQHGEEHSDGAVAVRPFAGSRFDPGLLINSGEAMSRISGCRFPFNSNASDKLTVRQGVRLLKSSAN